MTITAVILCGGEGTRLQPVIGSDLPKCLAPVADRPFLFHLLDQLGSFDGRVERIVICGGPHTQQIKAVIDPVISRRWQRTWHGALIRYAEETERLGTGGALRNALPLLESDPVLVLNGDTYCRFDLDWLLRVHRGGGWQATVMTAMRDHVSPAGEVRSHRLSSGICLLSRKLIASLADRFNNGKTLSLENQVIPSLEKRGSLHFVHTGFRCHDIGTPESYLSAEAFLREEGVIS